MTAVDPHPSSTEHGITRPFVYIASLRRTGSTVLAEALTKPGHSFIFREPHFGRNRFSLKDDDIPTFASLGIDIASLREAWLAGKKTRHVLDGLREELFPQVGGHFNQIGVKEIKHEGWRKYLDVFPGTRFVLSGRDPRDIYISLYQRHAAGHGSWKGEYAPKQVADKLLEQFVYQQEMAAEVEHLLVRYEDLCSDPSVMGRIKCFVGSTIPGVGDVGAFLACTLGRTVENDLHGGTITDKRVARWRQETDATLVADAHTCFELMPQYTGFWGYEPE